jgi:protein-disulfide isomerase
MKLRQIILAGVMGTSLVLNPMNAMAKKGNTFSTDQQDQIEVIVKEYLIKNPEILLEVSKALQKKQQTKMMDQASSAIENNAKQIFNSDSPMSGNAKGNVTLVQFFDYQCVHCKKMAPVMKGLLEKNSNLKIVYKDFPIFGKSSTFASEAVLAAQMQGKYHALHEVLINKSQRLSSAVVLKAADQVGINTTKLKADMKSDTVQKALLANRKLAEKLHLMGTPAFIVATTPEGTFSQGSESFFIPGAATEETLSQLITKATPKT